MGGVGKIVAYPEALQFFNDKVYPVRISLQKSLIGVAICDIYGMKWGNQPSQTRQSVENVLI